MSRETDGKFEQIDFSDIRDSNIEEQSNANSETLETVNETRVKNLRCVDVFESK